jgi:undecaprenyl-diphosphatase
MKSNKSIETMSIKDSIIIGICQVLALIPGFSRSGTTIAAARAVNINRVDAAKFSFYLSEPIVIGSLLYQLYKIDMPILVDNYNILLFGILISFTIGLLSINLLLKYLRSNNFKIFMWYRIILGIFILIYLYLL